MEPKFYLQHDHSRPGLNLILLVISSIGIIWAIYNLPVGMDWLQIRELTLAMLSFQSPYSTVVFNPPWVFVILLPIALLPFRIGAALLSFLNIAVVGYVALRMGKSPWLAALLLLTPAIARQIIDPNLEFLVALGFLLPPQLGLFLVLAKPQLGAPVALLWLIEAWREGGIRQVIKVFSPIFLITLISFAIFGFWPLHGLHLQNASYNYSMWPTSLVFGLPLIVYAIRTRQMDMAILSALFLAPYYGFYSLHIPLLGLLPRRNETMAGVIGFWILFLLRPY